MKNVKCSLPLLVSLLASPSYAAAIPVHTVTVQVDHHQPTLYLTAKLEAQEHAQLTSRVTGFLQKQLFPDGSSVNKGDVIFQIDDTTYRFALQSMLANQQQAEAAVIQAKLQYERFKTLVTSGSVTQANLDDASATLAIRQAELTQAKASVKKAKENLWHTKIRAPYNGQLGKSNFSTGDMVSPESGAIIDIVQQHPLNAAFSIGSEDLVQFPIDQPKTVSVSLQQPISKVGEIVFIDNKLNDATGTLSASAEFSNQDKSLRPNQITTLELASNRTQRGFWMPHSAVVQDLLTQFVYVVNEDGLAERREVTVVARDGNQIFVAEGLEHGDRVITEGLIRVRPNVPVDIQE
ncbi:efflux RND transporter periplasmic adaptor subunit [Vibrio mediterranei]|uniref:Efflux transporter periplasmic adaptor subunit n=1 Tax=Vibrio mediterranei TaxID=689 RepID=A0ABX5DJC6_9VIBR|nr:efflux RND transporter periplasmic adaptor subunit [Vibrio mediterranei]PCD90184.1 efflux transporter periplasmic adaptor subunit [Vibrio mediterranei]PRQ69570.1 efflux transporter periplasmic adaptor subunit [Vibrio mediterranei]